MLEGQPDRDRSSLMWTLSTLYARLAADPVVRRAVRHGLWITACLYLGVYLSQIGGVLGFDAHAYWLVWQHHNPYGSLPGARDAFLYSPAFAQAVWPLDRLSWIPFLVLWILGSASLYAWLLRPLAWGWRAPLLLLCGVEVIFGNIWPLLAAVVVLGFRRPWLWTLALLTKVTAGVGLIWFAVRREWRELGIVVGATIAVAAISAAISPGLWLDWLHFLVHSGDGNTQTGRLLPPVVRLPGAAMLAVYAAKRDRPRVLAVAMLLASPVFGLNSFAVLAALPRLSQDRPDQSRYLAEQPGFALA